MAERPRNRFSRWAPAAAAAVVLGACPVFMVYDPNEAQVDLKTF